MNFPQQPVLPVDLERQQRKEGAVGKDNLHSCFDDVVWTDESTYSAGEQSDVFVSKGWLCTKAKTSGKAPIQSYGVGWNIKEVCHKYLSLGLLRE